MKSNRRYLSAILSVLFLALFLFPIYWMVVTSVKPQTEIFAYPPSFFPSELSWSAWGRIFGNAAIPRYFLNSLIVGTGTTLFHLGARHARRVRGRAPAAKGEVAAHLGEPQLADVSGDHAGDAPFYHL